MKRNIVTIIASFFFAVIFFISVDHYVFQKNDSIDNQTQKARASLVDDNGVGVVKANCLGCHAEHLIIQNRASREGWESTIRWMQKTQNLWNLGSNEKIILDYLTKNYGLKEQGRRPQLSNIEWYRLEN